MNEDLIENVARAWASIDGCEDAFWADKNVPTGEGSGHYGSYIEEANELMKRSGLSDYLGRMQAENEQMKQMLAAIRIHMPECDGRVHVSTEDIRYVARPVMRHRLVTNFRAESDGVQTDHIVEKLFEVVRER